MELRIDNKPKGHSTAYFVPRLMTIPQMSPINAIASAKTSAINSFTKIAGAFACATTTEDPKTPTVMAAQRLARPTEIPPNPVPYPAWRLVTSSFN